MKTVSAMLADRILKVLVSAEQQRADLEQAAQARGITLPQLLAAALSEAILEKFVTEPRKRTH
jgi:hypothetical protein